MKLRIFAATLMALASLSCYQAQAVELITNGGFVPAPAPQPAPFWNLQEFVSTTLTPIDSAEVLNNSNSAQEGVRQLFLKAFAGGGTAGPNNLTNAILSQTVTGTAGQEYTFSGWSRYEANYSGGVETLAASSPLGAVASPTTNEFMIEFLNGSNSVIGSPFILDVTEDRIAQIGFDPEFHFANDNVLYQHTLNAVAPAGTAQVRVTAAARDMVFNTNPAQSAFYDSFSLKTTSDPVTEILLNPGLEDASPPVPNGLEDWDIVINDPAPVPTTELFRGVGFANRLAGGGNGVWISSFLGEVATPVSGNITQTVEAVPGGEYTFSGWARFETNYNTESTFFEVAFLDGGGNVIGTPETLDLVDNGQLNDGAWLQHTIEATAPAGAVSVRVGGGLLNGVTTTGAQSAFFDDFSLMLANASLPGDFDNDGDVDGRDFLAWQRNPSVGNLADWQAAYNGGNLAAIGSVPEPTTILSLAVGLVVCGLSRRGRIA